jgi:hydrogenase maturation protease
MKTRIIGLGNTLLRDDGVGVYVAREVARRLSAAGNSDAVEVVESEVAGFALLELMSGWDRVILIDSVHFAGVEPGTIIEMRPDDLHTSFRLRSAHEIDLQTAMRLGEALELPMPEEVKVLAIQAADLRTFGESVTEPVMLQLNQEPLVLAQASKIN